MSKKETPASHASTPPSAASERDSYAAELSRLAAEFDDHSHRLRSLPDSLVPIGAMRDAMSRAGQLLVDLLERKFIEAPRPMPPWLSWRMCPQENPEFSGWEGAPYYFRWAPNANLTTLLQSVSANRQTSEHGQIAQPRELDPTQIHHGLVFLEAVDGWVGRRCTPKVQVEPPVGRVLVGVNRTGLRRDDWPVLVTIDWDGRPLQQSALMFMRLGPGCATACRHLSALVSGRAASRASTITSRWTDAVAEWRRYAQYIPGSASGPARMNLRLAAFTPWPDKGVATQPCEFETDPSPSPTAMLRIAHDPTVEHFRPRALELANACGGLAAELDRHQLDPITALELERTINRNPVVPTVAQSDLIERLDLQIKQLALRVHTGPSPNQEISGERPVGASTHEFVKVGDAWRVTFQGVFVILFDSAGMRYLQKLLSSESPISPVDLEGTSVTGDSMQPVTDKASLRALQEAIDDADGHLENNTSLSMTEREALLIKKRQIESELRAARFRGRDRAMQSQHDMAINRVRAAIRRSLRHIKEKHPSLHHHLEESLVGRSSGSPCYRPITRPNWILNLAD